MPGCLGLVTAGYPAGVELLPGRDGHEPPAAAAAAGILSSLPSIVRPHRRPPLARHQSQPLLMPQHISLQQQPQQQQQQNYELMLGDQHYGLLGNSQQQRAVRSQLTLRPAPTPQLSLPLPVAVPSLLRQPSDPAHGGDTHTPTTLMPAPQVAAAAAALKSFMGDDEGPRQQRRHSAAAVAAVAADLPLGGLPPLMQAMQVCSIDDDHMVRDEVSSIWALMMSASTGHRGSGRHCVTPLPPP